MELLVIWHAGTVPQYKDRFYTLQQYFDDVCVVVPDGWQEVEEHPFPPDCVVETKFFRLPCLFPYHPYTILYLGLGRLIRERNPDLIYIHEEPIALCTLQTALHARRASIPYVVDSALNHTAWSLWGANPVEQYVYRTASLVYYRNDQCYEALRERGCLEEKLHGPMPNGVSERTFFPVTRDEAEAFLHDVSNGCIVPRDSSGKTQMRLGFAGRICYEKGVDILIRVSSLISNIEVILCGPMIDTKYEDILQETSDVYYLGELDGKDMNKFYSACDLIALPSLRTSRWEEQFGRVLTESIACETPAIGSNIGMIDEIVGEEAVFPEGDVRAFADLIESLRDNSNRSSLFEKQAQRVQRRYTWSVIAETVWEDTQDLTRSNSEKRAGLSDQ